LQDTLLSLTKKGLITENQEDYGLEASGKRSETPKLMSYNVCWIGCQSGYDPHLRNTTNL